MFFALGNPHAGRNFRNLQGLGNSELDRVLTFTRPGHRHHQEVVSSRKLPVVIAKASIVRFYCGLSQSLRYDHVQGVEEG